jgi:hypothetical protein
LHVSSVFSKPFPLCFFSCTTAYSLFFIGFLQSFTRISSSLSKGLLVPLPFIFCIGVSCFSSIVFSMPFPFFLCIGVYGKGCPLKSPLGIDDLVKGLLPLISTVGGGEGKRRFFHFFYFTFVEYGTSSNPGGGGGDEYLCGEGHTSSSTSLTYLLISGIRALPFIFLLTHVLVLVGDEEPAICDWGVGVGSSLK